MHGKYESSSRQGGKGWIAVLLAVLVLAAVTAGILLKKNGGTAPTEPSVPETSAETTEATAEATTEAATEATTEPAPVYTNPLTGEVVDEPVTRRVFSVSINNLRDSLPHIGTMSADIYMEMFVNYSIIRGIAFYTDPTDVPAIGSVRSTRPIFSQLSRIFDTVMLHAGGTGYALNDAKQRGVDGFNIDTPGDSGYSFRDKDRLKQGYGLEHTLFVRGTTITDEAVNRGIRVDADPEKDYGLRFSENAVPENGEDAAAVSLTFSYNGSKKDTSMIYDGSLGKYVYNQYGKSMVDGATDEPEAFKNVVILLAEMKFVGHGYHQADFILGGEGYFATEGKLIPIQWHCDTEEGPLRLETKDGEELHLNVGNSYFAIAAVGSPVTWEAAAAGTTE